MIKNTSLCYTTPFSTFRLQKPNNWTNLSVRAHARETYIQKKSHPSLECDFRMFTCS